MRFTYSLGERGLLFLLTLVLLAACMPPVVSTPTPGPLPLATVTEDCGSVTCPGTLPTAEMPLYRQASAPVSDRVADLLARMTLEEKIGQMTQVDISYLKSPQDIATYYLGSLLAGGNSDVTGNTPQAWADTYDAHQAVALTTRLGIPLLYGTDAVHGHNNVVGAVIFPHNIGLGATRDSELAQAVARITAEEMVGTGFNWNFAPCVCVGRDERWGRSYECYGEEPQLVASLTASQVQGFQGEHLGGEGSVLATAKHWVGDGGTAGGEDQGDTQVSEKELRSLFFPPYAAAIDSGVGAVMVSFSSWNGVKMHANKYLITEVLKGEMGFTGLVVSDWGAVKQLPGNEAMQVRTAINAGLDMIMVPDDYRAFIRALRGEVEAGRVAMARIDDAVRRILTQKFTLGLFEHPYANRDYQQNLGSEGHRAVARRAVAESLVLLKNEGGLLPLPKSGVKLLVAGKNADNLGYQCGGWTISWQGAGGEITAGTTILEGIQAAVAPDTVVTYDPTAESIDASYSAAIVVIGEKPYAEMMGDRPGTQGLELDDDDRTVLQRVQAAGVPTVVIIVAGRPLIITDHLPNWQALLMAWLPGTEGAGVADVLFGDYAPTGKLPLSWPKTGRQIPINVGDEVYEPLFEYGWGLTYP